LKNKDVQTSNLVAIVLWTFNYLRNWKIIVYDILCFSTSIFYNFHWKHLTVSTY